LAQKSCDFIGRAVLERNVASPRRQLVCPALQTKEIPRPDDHVYLGRDRVGVVTSAARSPSLGHTIALARVAVEVSEVDRELEIGQLDGLRKRLLAKVTAIPFKG
jgi:aminomethyltransferase